MKKEKEHSVHNHEHEHEHSHEHSCGCDCCGCGEHEHKHSGGALEIVITVIGALLIAVSFLPMFGDTVKDILLMAATVICALPIFIDAIKDLKEREISEEFLLVVAVMAACALGEFFEAATVSVLFRAGELMEEFAGDRSRKSIEALFSIVSDTANLVQPDGTVKKIDADEVTAGAKLAVMPHEVVPVDGTVTEGEGSMDASALTGESMPIAVKPGTTILSGMMNGDSIIYFEATAGKSQSSAARIVEMVDEASKKKGKAQRAVAKFAKYYTPAIVGAAVLIAVIPSLITGNWHDWIHRSLILLVASCPCAIVISAPLAFFTTMGAAAKNGMIIKGSRYIEALAKVDTAVFDKTGTLTQGRPEVIDIIWLKPADDRYIDLLIAAETQSQHPLAKAIVSHWNDRIPGKPLIEHFENISGKGIEIKSREETFRIGNRSFVFTDSALSPETEEKISSWLSEGKSVVYYGSHEGIIAIIAIADRIKKSSAEAVTQLQQLGIEVYMLTGDNEATARSVAQSVGITRFKAEVLPQDKEDFVSDLQKAGKTVAMVGDGINDSQALACADVSIAMGQGTDIAMQVAMVTLMNSDLLLLTRAIRLSRSTTRIIRENLFWAFIYNVVCIPIAAGILFPINGWMLNPMWASAAMAFSSVSVVLNSLRLKWK